MDKDLLLAEEYLLKVDEYFAASDFVSGKRLLEDLLEIMPDSGKAHNHLGWLNYAKLDNYERAEMHFKLAIKFESNYPFSYKNYVYMLNYLGRYDEAITWGKRAMEIEGIEKELIHNEKGRAYELKGDYINALFAFRQAIEISTSDDNIDSYRRNIRRVKNKMSIWQRSRLFYRFM